MRTLFLAVFLAVPVASQAAELGVFTNSGDVGGPTIKGSAVFDAGKGEYKMTGAGANIWAKEDQFQYVWKEMSGNVAVTATLQFIGESAAQHRKAGIMLRKSLDTDSPYVDVIIHGNGMPAIQWRNTKGDTTNGVDYPFDSPGKFKLKLIRQGNAVAISVGKDGAELKQIGQTQVPLGNPVMVGLAVCSHNAGTSESVVFSDVSLESLPMPAAKKK